MDLGGLLGDIVGGAELDVCFFEVIFDTTRRKGKVSATVKRRRRLGRYPMGRVRVGLR